MTGSLRTIQTLDQLALERHKRAPESGPAVLFFSGGTALREMSKKLIRYTHNSIHLITPFDSGGSSAVLRKAFSMPAVGDIRNRLMALVDQSVPGNNGIYALFTYRFPKGSSQVELRSELRRMSKGEHFLVNSIPGIKGEAVMELLQRFLEVMPDWFDLRGASIGNLVLTAGYLHSGRRLAPVIDNLTDLAKVRGTVRPVVDVDCHLAAELENGSRVVGQHLMTGKETTPLKAPVKTVWLTRSLGSEVPARVSLSEEVASLIRAADLICFPPGSLCSSVIANLLPLGVGKALAANPCPKVFVPSTGADLEIPGVGVASRVAMVRNALEESGMDAGLCVPDTVVMDLQNGAYDGGADVQALQNSGINILDCRLITEESAPGLDGVVLSELLVSLARRQ